MDNTKKKLGRSVLGRGLGALISTPVTTQSGAASLAPEEMPSLQVVTGGLGQTAPEPTSSATLAIRFVDIDRIAGNPGQPRKSFREEELRELADSIKEVGVLQPILVRPSSSGISGSYEIVAGERRWRAAKLAGAYQVPVIIHDLGDLATFERAIIENVQREDLGAVEQALAYQKLAEEFSLSHEEIAQKVGKDRATISNFIRLLKLPKDVLTLIDEGALAMGHAKAILAVKEPSIQSRLAKKAASEGLSVRALESLASQVTVIDAGKTPKHRVKSPNDSHKDATSPDVIEKLRRALGTKVSLRHHPSGRGKLEIEYFSSQELERIIDIICGT